MVLLRLSNRTISDFSHTISWLEAGSPDKACFILVFSCSPLSGEQENRRVIQPNSFTILWIFICAIPHMLQRIFVQDCDHKLLPVSRMAVSEQARYRVCHAKYH